LRKKTLLQTNFSPSKTWPFIATNKKTIIMLIASAKSWLLHSNEWMTYRECICHIPFHVCGEMPLQNQCSILVLPLVDLITSMLVVIGIKKFLTYKRRCGHSLVDEWQRISPCRTKMQLFILPILCEKGISSIVVWLPMRASALF